MKSCISRLLPLLALLCSAFMGDEPVLHAAPGGSAELLSDGGIVMTCRGKGMSSAVFHFVLNQPEPSAIRVCAESKSERDDGSYGDSYGFYTKFTYQDGSSSCQYSSGFKEGAHDWRIAERLFIEKKPIREMTVTLRYGYRTGKVYFRNLKYTPVQSRRAEPSQSREAREAQLGHLADFKRDYCIDTMLVKDGQAAAVILGEEELARQIVEVVRERTGVTLPVLQQDPGKVNLITIGSRDRNAFVSDLYTRHYTLLDGKYPGYGGSEVRTLHNIFGDRRNIVTVGGSDLAGDHAAVDKLVGMIRKEPAGKSLHLGFIADVTLSPRYKLPSELQQAPTWAESPGYGNAGFFGWNILSKNLAMLYITGEARYAREFMRLAFPADKSVQKELLKLDGEAFHDHSNPIVNVDHYRAIMMILYWELVEENPAFSEDDRQKVNSAFYRLMVASLLRRTYPDLYIRFHAAKPTRGDRHVSWEACNLFALGRYFDKYYPGEDSKEALRIAGNAFGPALKENLSDNSTLYFLASSVEPFQVYASLALGDQAVGNSLLKEYVRSVTMLAETDTHGEHAYMLRNTPAAWLLQGAYLAQDEAPIRLLKTAKTETEIFRLGQSWWPSQSYPGDTIRANIGRWTKLAPSPSCVDVGPEPLFPREKVIRYMTYRWDEDNFILADTMGGYALREQPHQFAMFSARLRGVPMLRGHWNTMQFYADGQCQPLRRYYSEVLDSGHAGDYAWITAKVASINGFDWIRTWLIRKNAFLLAADRVIPLEDYRTAEILMQFVPFREDVKYQEIPLNQVNKIRELPTGEFAVANPKGDYLVSSTASVPGRIAVAPWHRYGDHYGAAADYMEFSESLNGLKKGQELRFVQLVRFGKPDGQPSTAMQGSVVSLRLPESAKLQFSEKNGFVLVMPGETFTLKDGIGTLEHSGTPGTLHLERKLVKEDKPAVRKEHPLWTLTEDFASSHLQKSGDVYIAFGKCKAVSFSGDGTVLCRFVLPDWVRCAVYVPEKQMYLFGCVDEQLVAMDECGQELWRFTSVMHPGMLRIGDWVHKKSYPGVWSLAYRNDRIYAGSAGTIEVLTPDGKLLERTNPNIACQVTMFVPRDQRMLASFGASSWGLYTILDGKEPLGKADVYPDKSQIGQAGSFRYFTEMDSGDFCGAIIGKQQRLAVWNREFNMKYFIALGDGETDAPVGIAVNGRKIAVATARMRGYVYTDKLDLLEEYRLPAHPAAVDFSRDKPVFGLKNGQLYSGGFIIGIMPGQITGMLDGIVLDSLGNLIRL